MPLLNRRLLLIPIGLMSFIIPIKILSLNLNKADRADLASLDRDKSYTSQQRKSFNQQIASDLGALNRMQQANYFEFNKYADSYEELSQLGMGLLLAKANYELIIENKGGTAFSYAVPKKNATYKQWSGSAWVDASEPLFSYVAGITYSKENNFFDSIICVGTIEGKKKLQEPKNIADKLVCADGTKELF